MSRNRLIPALIACAVAISACVFAVTLYRAVWSAGNESVSMPPEALSLPAGSVDSASSAEQRPPPARLLIARVGIDAAVQKVGITETGRMANPTNFSDVGWYRYGPAPGAPGNAVIAGHVDNGLGRAGVFQRLSAVLPGDIIAVIDEYGAETVFRVVDAKIYPFDAPTGDIFTVDGPPQLLLITCTGEWIPAQKMYAQRLIVAAEPVSP